MKKILLFLLLIVSIYSFGQTGYQTRKVKERIDGRFMVDSVFNMPRYTDTTAANLHKGLDTCGAMFFSYTKDSVYYRACNPKRWICVGSGSGGGGFNISNSDLTSGANHTLDLNGFTQTITGGTWGHDSIRFTNTVIYPTPDSLFAMGDSYTNPGSNASPFDSSYIDRYRVGLGLVLDNQATSGRGAWLATSNANANENPGHTKMATFLAGFNDMRRGGNDARTYNKVINALKNIFINHYLSGYQSAGNGANVTRYGTWTTTYPASTIGGKSVSLGAYTTVLNDSIVYSFTNDNVAVTVILGDGTTEVYSNSIEIYIDGVLQNTFSALYGTDAISDGSDGNTRQPGGFIYSGLSYGAHKIKLINKQTSKLMIIDYFGHLVSLNNAYPFVIFHAPKIDATGYATAPANASNTIIDNLNTKIDSLVATFPSGYPVYVAPTNSYFTNTTASGDLDAADHIHPTNQGHRHIYDAAVSVYSSLPISTGLARRFFWSGDRPYAFDNTNTARGLVYQGEAASVAGSNKQFQYNNGGSFGGASGVEYGNTNNLVKIESPATGNMMLLTKGFAGQTAPHYQVQSSAGTPLFNIEADGGVQVLGLVNNPIGSGSIEMEYRSGVGTITSYNRGGSSWQPLTLRASTTTIKSSNVDKVIVAGSRISLLDSVYLTDAIPYNSGAGIVHLGIDTVTSSPTFGKLVRKTAGASTLQQVFNTEVGGSVLTKSDSILLSGFNMRIIGNSNSTLYGFNNSGTFFSQNTGSSTAVLATSGTGVGLAATTTSGAYAASFGVNPSSTNTIIPIISLQRNSSGTAATGLGGSIDFENETSGGTNRISNQIISVLRNGADANRQSQLVFTGLGNASIAIDTLATMGDYVNLTESTATIFTSTVIATGKIAGGQIVVTIEGNDGTDFQARTMRVVWSAVNKAGTLTMTLGTPEEVAAVSTGTLTCTLTMVDGGSGVLQFKANAVSSLTQTTLRCSYQTFKNF